MKSATRLIAHWSAVSLYLLSLSFPASAQMGDMEQTGGMQGMCPMCGGGGIVLMVLGGLLLLAAIAALIALTLFLIRRSRPPR
jgi:hypothetical protein